MLKTSPLLKSWETWPLETMVRRDFGGGGYHVSVTWTGTNGLVVRGTVHGFDWGKRVSMMASKGKRELSPPDVPEWLVRHAEESLRDALDSQRRKQIAALEAELGTLPQEWLPC